jgi:hypothetical protein
MIIYVVEGQTGEYSDNRNWIVKGFVSEEKAKDFVVRVSEEYRKLRATYGGDFWYNDWDREKFPNPLDPYMEADYTGTTYCYFTVEVDEEK